MVHSRLIARPSLVALFVHDLSNRIIHTRPRRSSLLSGSMSTNIQYNIIRPSTKHNTSLNSAISQRSKTQHNSRFSFWHGRYIAFDLPEIVTEHNWNSYILEPLKLEIVFWCLFCSWFKPFYITCFVSPSLVFFGSLSLWRMLKREFVRHCYLINKYHSFFVFCLCLRWVLRGYARSCISSQHQLNKKYN